MKPAVTLRTALLLALQAALHDAMQTNSIVILYRHDNKEDGATPFLAGA